MYRLAKIISRSIIFMFCVAVFLYSGSYKRVLDPLMNIRINGQIMPLTGGLNRPEPQFLDWNGDGLLDCFINDRDGRLQYWEGLVDWQFGDRPIFMLITKIFQDLLVGTWFNFNDFDGDGDYDLLSHTPGTDNVSYYNNVNGTLQLVNSQLHTPSGFPVYGGQIVIPTVVDIDADGYLDYFVGDISGRLAYYAGQGYADTGPLFEFVSDYFENIQIIWTPARHGANSISFYDLDNDSDLDLIWGDFYQPGLFYLENYGDNTDPHFVDSLMVDDFPGSGMLETAGFNIPIITDFEPDGTGDLVVGVLSGAYGTDYINNLAYFKNNGAGAEYDFQLVTMDLLPGLDLIVGSRPVLADLDGDNDRDLVVGTEFNPDNSLSGGQIYYFENTTNDDMPEYVLSDSTFIDNFITTNLAPSFYDLDGDGDLDAIIGEFNGYLLHYTNTDTGWIYNGHYMNLDLSGKTVPAWGDVDDDDDDDLVLGTKDGMVMVYINNGDINALVLAVQLDIGDDASPAILADGSIVVGNKIGELILLRYDDTDNLVVQDTLVYPYCGQNLTPCPISPSGIEQEDLVIGSKAGGLQYLEYSTLAIQEENKNNPRDFSIKAIYPNPNNGYCKIDLDISKSGFYEISIYDLQGRLVRIIHHGSLSSGRYSFTLRANIPSGIYFIHVQSNHRSVFKKMIRLK
tara:strand:- start:2055 stop:4097 length:2043 start_codon:yes stop_codon:yes gene_type:complete